MTATGRIPKAPNRRAFLAWAVLQDVPLPRNVLFAHCNDPDAVALECDELTDVTAWADLLGVKTPPVQCDLPDFRSWWFDAKAGGWRIHVTASWRPRAGGLDDATREQLAAVAEGGAR